MNNPFGKHFLHYNLHKIGFQEPLAIGNPKKKEDVRDLVFTKLILAAMLNDDPISMQRRNRTKHSTEYSYDTGDEGN